MEHINTIILKKLSKSSSSLYESPSPYDDYEFDPQALWTSIPNFQSLKKSFKFFSTELLFSNILFSKSTDPRKTQWFKANFYALYSDRLVLYSVFFAYYSLKFTNLTYRKKIFRKRRKSFSLKEFT